MDCGFATSRGAYQDWTPELSARLKALGVKTVLVTVWMGRVQNQDGSYNQTRLNNLLSLVNMLKDTGLTPIISLRVHIAPDIRNYDDGYTTWANGLPQAEWIINNEEGTTRFLDCWKKLVETLNPSKICLWHFPGHNGGLTAARDNYMTVWGAKVVREIRSYFKGEIIFVLPYQASSEANSSKSYWMNVYDPLPDDCDVTYGVGHMTWWDIASDPSSEWNYDSEQLEKDFSGIARYRALGKRVCSIEFGALEYDGQPTIKQSRMDDLEAILKKMKEYGVTYTYWCIRPHQTVSSNFITDINTMDFQPQLETLLPKYFFGQGGAGTPTGTKAAVQVATVATIIVLFVALAALLRGGRH